MSETTEGAAAGAFGASTSKQSSGARGGGKKASGIGGAGDNEQAAEH